jgi:signal transduction histidine kinase
MITSDAPHFMAELSDYLSMRREAILEAWGRAVDADVKQTTASSLTREQFNDHIPEILDAFERRLRAGAAADGTRHDGKAGEVKHGVTRWHQGYRLQEVMHEWGHLQMCLLAELDAFSAANPEFDRSSLVEAGRYLALMVNEAVCESAVQYQHMQQAEAASHIDDLMAALTDVLEIERHRSMLIHQAVHDLGNNVNSVGLAASVLGDREIAEAERVEFASILQQGVQSVSVMLGELMELARLEAGQERRDLSDFDATALVAGVCDLNRAFARDRNLFLRLDHFPPIPVEGDAGKIRRLLGNLMRNAFKYTEHGGVSIGLGEDERHWWVRVVDTGPGLPADVEIPLLTEIKKATQTASGAQGPVKPANTKRDGIGGIGAASGHARTRQSAKHAPGEGIGLSIVKRLCDLLDARLEVTSSPALGTAFKVVFPKHYPTAAH